ncbi:hypothetical protein [Treponema sp. C6A8]|uniref:flagellar biosynthesis protein FlhF n=1 Tax=Treponema sp. C6A8 TaxID=1410609 RepID=UPI000688BF57|nr:hypothetical protein [Treponema sp. C6A8]
MAYERENIQKIVADNLDECKEKISRMYGRDWVYRGHDRKLVKYGPLNLFKKWGIEMKYIVGHSDAYSDAKPSKKNEEDAEFEKNKAALLVQTLSAQLTSQLTQKLEETKNELSAQIATKSGSSADEPEAIVKIEDMLYQNDFSKDYIKEISEKIRANFSLEQLENFDLVEHKVVDWIGESIEVALPKVHRPPHVVIIVGPTGVGKTTTLVKLAAQFMLSYRKDERNQGRRPNLCFITTDFMRVGALQQLERFGDIMSYSVLKAEKTEDLKVLYDENKDNMDAIFIDTSGCSPNDATHLAQMKLLLDIPQMNPDIYLAVTASSKARDLENIFKNYEPFGYNSVIITKSDESLQYGNVISVLHKKHKAVSYITNGQNVTQDLRQASIVDFLIRLEGFDIDRQHIEGKFGGK